MPYITTLTQPNLSAAATISFTFLQNYPPYTDCNQQNDYVFTLTSNILWKIRRVLIKVPIQLYFENPDCMQWTGSTVTIEKCYIDLDNNDIWIHLFHDPVSAYAQTSQSIIFRTMNSAAKNPNTVGANSYSFSIKMYNWTQPYEPLGTTQFDRDSDERVYF